MKTLYTALKSTFTHKALGFLLSSLAFLPAAQAQTAGNWNFNGTLAGTAGSSITVSGASLGTGIPSTSFNGGTEYYGENGWPAGALDPNAYMQFTLTATSAHYLVLNTVNLVQRRSNTGTPQGAGPTQWSLRSSLDNYASDISSGTMTYNYATYTVTLPAAFHAIASSVTFRVYGYATTVNAGGSSRFVFDNISIQGSSISGILAEQSIHLAAAPDAGKVSLQWNTAGFEAGTEFTLERSSNGRDFETLHSEQSAAAADQQYRYTDLSVGSSTTLFYRVAARIQGVSIYMSPVVTLKQSATQDMQIKGVVAGGNSVKTFLRMEAAGSYQLSVWSQDGRMVMSQSLSGQAGDATADLSLGARPHGIYILTLSKEGQRSSRQFVY